MRLYHEVRFVEITPANGVPRTVFQEVNGSLELIVPPPGHNLAFGFIDENERARLDKRIHGPIFTSHKGVPMVLKIYSVQQHQWKRSPPLNHPAEIGGALQVKSGIEREGELNMPSAIGAEPDHMCALNFNLGGVRG